MSFSLFLCYFFYYPSIAHLNLILMLSQRKFNIQKFKMTEQMRTSILDEVRKVIQANKTDIQAAETLKKTIEQKYGGKWQVVIGKDMVVYFDEGVIKDYIILQTQIKIMIIFRKKMAEEIQQWLSLQEHQSQS